MSLRRYARYKYIKLIRLKDSPSKIAKGIALGIALDFLPLPLISLPVAFIVARVARFNSIAAVSSAALFKLAVPFFWTLDVTVGRLLQGHPELPQQNMIGADPLHTENINNVLVLFQKWGAPFLIGSVVNAIAVGILVYLLFNRILAIQQKKRKHFKSKTPPA